MFNESGDARDILFLYPSRHFEETAILEIIKHEYDVFILQNHQELNKVCRLANHPIVIINIDFHPRGLSWNSFIKELQSEFEDSMLDIFILTASDRSVIELENELKVFSTSNGVESCTKNIMTMLQECNAIGRRKYVRTHVDDPHRASFSLKRNGEIHTGTILDISTNGMACYFQKELPIPLKSYLNDLQLRLDGIIMKIAGEVAAVRESKSKVYIVLFDYKVTYKYREKIQYFIYHNQQRLLQHELNSMDKKIN
jgi:hypothetical protein